ncbi:NitT/TauT family transport system ATP-binding protein [Pseudomonas frederiksbergensis]|jgi:NitT/TauT family transport system ATP-binding protein|uniref:NitT/TauT family transport system ATP-binding protein n=1 Tax=Pseudomonas frederiksbergensis TaxID=104087 RepID=A0A1H4ME79_9PSED|nr:MULTISPECIES: ABC transporter ATP-binding protein [Pseudomonas]PMU09844.1 ABC transporter ATP-binding protein [Pseudomonas sp. FW305-20]PMU17017.1 ABC transporter ATP-binding protein [Pseudomonas sp. FW305-122]PMU37599.1 ABC transporter ATP-binding protein [Pseudomonas sp. FW305-47B]PMX61665.1 ABC transporter ATP-binding protein [Pseudomonas sp. FW305-33]PMX70501.1 ABC transporter ATP-binding protein [Pseudomonas sp. FW305-60]
MGSVSAVNPRFITPQPAPVHAAPRLQVDKVSLRYQKPDGGVFTALDQVSFEVPDQQFAVLVGPSGCGKSSLLYLTAGLNEPTEGEIYVGGQQVQGPGADRGMVFQSYTLFPWLTVRQNVEFGLKRRGMAAAQRKEIVDYYVNEVGLSGFADNYAKQLSGGMMQRVAIARALANDPQILLMDEPFGALDSQTRLQMQQLLLRVWGNSKKTVLFVTHDIDEAILLGDRVYVMGARPGRIKQILDVPIERPRTLDMVMERSFIDMKRRIFGLLHDELEEEH